MQHLYMNHAGGCLLADDMGLGNTLISAKEGQATDRAYRIGQTKDVYVYYPMAVSPNFQAFDVTLDDLLARKSNLASSTIYPTERAEVKVEELGAKLFNIVTNIY